VAAHLMAGRVGAVDQTLIIPVRGLLVRETMAAQVPVLLRVAAEAVLVLLEVTHTPQVVLVVAMVGPGLFLRLLAPQFSMQVVALLVAAPKAALVPVVLALVVEAMAGRV
jgi:hypothetical protein